MTGDQATEERYQQSLDYLVNLTKFGFNFGLERITRLLERVGNPHHQLKVIHVGGTNGKGSTTAMIASILRQAGYRIGTFTSPHLHDYRERITINGEMIAKEDVIALIDYLRPHLEHLVESGLEHPTEFEVSTAMALIYLARQKVDYAVIEVGLGGAIDSTNVVSPLVTVLTNVAMDHMDYLGKDIEEIATVKAGIIKEGAVVVTAAEHPDALRVIRNRTAAVNAKLIQVGQDISYTIHQSTHEGQVFDFHGINRTFSELFLPLSGSHQIRNAACALAVCEVLAQHDSVAIDDQTVYAGLKQVRWPGRLELLSRKPQILLDGAHNVAGAKALANALSLYKRQRLIMCLGMLGDKEREKVGDILIPLADELIVTKPNSPRAGDWELLAQRASSYGKPVQLIESPKEAAIAGVNRLQDDDLLCITGSLYMLAEARAALVEYLSGEY